MVEQLNSEIIIPFSIQEEAKTRRNQEPLTFGIPFPKGLLADLVNPVLTDPDENRLPVQFQVVKHWSDGSIKWILLDTQVSIEANEKRTLQFHPVCGESSPEATVIAVHESEGEVRVDTKCAVFCLSTKEFKPFKSIHFDGKNVTQDAQSHVTLVDSEGKQYVALIDHYEIETLGPLRCSICFEGFFGSNDRDHSSMRFVSRVHLFANLSISKIEFTIWNQSRARHPGGLWDLGDPGSLWFSDLSMKICPVEKVQHHGLVLFDEEKKSSSMIHHDRSKVSVPSAGIKIYQDSSGGVNWQSPNHVNQHGEVKTTFRGYRVYENGIVTLEGNRIQPTAYVESNETRIYVASEYFWQNFPSALESGAEGLRIGIFPKEFNDVYELQPGEQKTHTFYVRIDNADDSEETGCLNWIHSPLLPYCDSEWYESTGCFPLFKHSTDAVHSQIIQYIDAAAHGEFSLFERREIIDEFGWRNFGEMYADHEAVYHDEKTIFVSHYNNQYDGLWGLLFQFLRTGKRAWFNLGTQLCSHVRDIDVYHTSRDRTDFNHGLFWHTEHHLSAETATHRCFSKRHETSRNLNNYGGAPALAHTYTSGLLLHYYLTGQKQSFQTVVELAKFIKSSVKLNSTVVHFFFSTLKRIGAKIKNRGKLVDLSRVYGLNGPGRGSGNSLNVLMDAFELTGDRQYLDIAENVIAKCIHPDDEIEKRNLLDRENRWMYTIFLKSLCRYLDVKAESGEFDDRFGYARDSLVKYARWMIEREDLYLNERNKLEFPNETWAAQEFRKADVLLAVAAYVNASDKLQFIKKGQFFLQGGVKGLQEFGLQALLTRPLVLMMTTGWEKRNKTEDQNSIFLSTDFKKVKRRSRQRYRRIGSKYEISISGEVEWIKNKMR